MALIDPNTSSLAKLVSCLGSLIEETLSCAAYPGVAGPVPIKDFFILNPLLMVWSELVTRRKKQQRWQGGDEDAGEAVSTTAAPSGGCLGKLQDSQLMIDS